MSARPPFPPPLTLPGLLLGRREVEPVGTAYKMVGTLAPYGLDVAGDGALEFNAAKMWVRVPFADGSRRDGVGDLLEIGGIDTSRHIANPLMLFDHGKGTHFKGYASWPIAMAEDPETKAYLVDIDPVSKRAWATGYVYQGKGVPDVDRKDEYDFAVHCQQIFHLVTKGFFRSGSIGYQVKVARELPPDFENGTPKGLHLLATRMLEASIVVVPANADTVGKGLAPDVNEILCVNGVCGHPLSPYLRKSLEAAALPRKAQLGWETGTTGTKSCGGDCGCAKCGGAKALDAQGGEVPTDLERAKKVDLITLPEGDSGTNCGNCKFAEERDTGLFCINDAVKMAVTDRNCCALWDGEGTLRAWEQGGTKNLDRDDPVAKAYQEGYRADAKALNPYTDTKRKTAWEAGHADKKAGRPDLVATKAYGTNPLEARDDYANPLSHGTTPPAAWRPGVGVKALRLRYRTKATPEGPYQSPWTTGNFYVVTDWLDGEVVWVVVRNGSDRSEGVKFPNRRLALQYLKDNGFEKKILGKSLPAQTKAGATSRGTYELGMSPQHDKEQLTPGTALLARGYLFLKQAPGSGLAQSFAKTGDRVQVVQFLPPDRVRVANRAGVEETFSVRDFRLAKPVKLPPTPEAARQTAGSAPVGPDQWKALRMRYRTKGSSDYEVEQTTRNGRKVWIIVDRSGYPVETPSGEDSWPTEDAALRALTLMLHGRYGAEGKSLPDIRLKYRAPARRRLRKSIPGASTMVVAAKDVDAAKEDAETRGLGFASMGPAGDGLYKIKLTGDDAAIDGVAKRFGKSLTAGAKAMGCELTLEWLPGMSFGSGSVGWYLDDSGKQVARGEVRSASDDGPQFQAAYDAAVRQGKAKATALGLTVGRVIDDTKSLGPRGGVQTKGGKKSVAPIRTLPDALGRERESLSPDTLLNSPGGTETTKTMNRGKAMPNDNDVLESAEQDIEGAEGAAAEGKALESYGAQVTRHLHARHKSAMLENEEFLKLLDHEPTIKHLTKDQEHHTGQLDALEKSWHKHFGDKGYEPLEDADAANESEAPEEEGKDLDETDYATSGEELPEVAEDPTEPDGGIGEKGRLRMQIKRLQARVKALDDEEEGKDKDKHLCGACAKAKGVSPAEGTDLGDEEHQEKPGEPGGDVAEGTDLGDEEFQAKPHELASISEAKDFLGKLAGEGSEFGEEDRMESFYHGKQLGNIHAAYSKSEIPGDLEFWQEEAAEAEHKDMTDEAEQAAGVTEGGAGMKSEHLAAIGEAADHLKALAMAPTFGDAEREKSAMCAKALDALGQMGHEDDAAEVTLGDTGEKGDADLDDENKGMDDDYPDDQMTAATKGKSMPAGKTTPVTLKTPAAAKFARESRLKVEKDSAGKFWINDGGEYDGPYDSLNEIEDMFLPEDKGLPSFGAKSLGALVTRQTSEAVKMRRTLAEARKRLAGLST